jgi:hypothetical protein
MEDKTQKEDSGNSVNVVLKKFQKDNQREDKSKKWRGVDQAVSAARQAYCGSYCPKEDEKTVSFEKSLGDLIEVLQKIKDGDVKLGGLIDDSKMGICY